MRVVALLERLEAERPGSQTAHLGVAYANLFTSHTSLGRPQAAVEAAGRAVHFERLLADSDPQGRSAGLGPDGRQARYALALCDHGQALATAGRWADGFRAHATALDVLVLLAEQDTERHRNDLGATLLNIGADLSASGRGGAAVAATEGAVHLLGPRTAVGDPPNDPNDPDHPGTYALALSNLSGLLLTWRHALPVGTDWRSRALDASTRAVKINRHRAGANPDALAPSLEQSLRTHAGALEAKGRAAEARAVRAEADELRSRMRPPPDVSDVSDVPRADLMAADDDPGSYREDVVRTLGLLARFHEETGVAERASAVRREIRRHRPPWRWLVRPTRRGAP
ncbi:MULTISPECIES: hypothetical protein [unclassified Streptomyces]|uniref:hypothetical protein n=1 Tax=unclassified Streptomyces TaxID=2593676 RepID=UPI0013A6D40D|nr:MULTISPECIES: hypothetical protein [unclassified Streptomyces]